MQNLRVRVLNVKYKLLTLQGNFPYFDDASEHVSLHLGWVFSWRNHFSASFTHLDVTLLSFVEEDLFVQFSVLFQRKLFHV